MKKSIIIALDLGTTGNRAIAYSKDGAVLASQYEEFPQYFPKPGWVEHDPMEIWHSAKTVLNAVLNRVGSDNVAALGITNQRETTVVWNKETGEPIHNAIVWQCRRTANRCSELSEYASSIKAKTGLFLDAYFSATKLEWLLNNNEDARARAENGDLLFGTIDTWVLWNLTNGATHATDVSNASRTMLYNIHDRKWDTELLGLFEVPSAMLPSVLPTDGNFGSIVSASGIAIESPIPVHAVIGDQQAALFAQCGWATNEIKNTYGTGLFVMANSGDTPVKTERLVSTIAWEINHVVNYALEGSIFVGGSLIQWLRDELGIIMSAHESDSLAQSVTSNGGVVVVPALTGLGAPHWDPSARGTILGLTRGSTKAHLARASLESLAYQTRDVIDAIKSDTGSQFTTLKVDGGASENSFLMQFQADLLTMNIVKASATESTALGAAMVAGMSAGIWNEDHIRSKQVVSTTYNAIHRPEMHADYSRWKRAVERAKNWFD